MDIYAFFAINNYGLPVLLLELFVVIFVVTFSLGGMITCGVGFSPLVTFMI